MIEIGASPHYFLSLALILARVGGVMVFAPFWSSFAISPLIRIVLSIALTATLFPLLADRLPPVPSEPVSFVVVLAGELAIGLVLGLVGQLFLGILQLAGSMMGFQMGFSLVNVIDPQTRVEISVLSVFYSLAGLTLFVVLDAHHWFLQTVSESYRLLPPGGIGLQTGLLAELMRLTSEMFLLGLQLAFPMVSVGILVDLLLGVIGRAAPQIHILIAGLPVKVLAGFAVLAMTAGVLLPFMGRHLEELRENLFSVLRLMAG